MTMPRRIRLDLATPPEVALRAALAAVEAMPADTRLTEASTHVSAAIELVGRYVDEQMGGVTLGDEEIGPKEWKRFAESFGRRLRHGAKKRGEDVAGDAELSEPCTDLERCTPKGSTP
jgi:hypothetical protein